MSIKLTNKVWEEAGVNGSDLLVLLCLADHANETGVCWPSLARIAQRTRISTRQAQRILQKLETAGHIEVLVKGDGRGHSTHYRVVVKGDIAMSTFVEERVTSEAERVTSRAIKGDIAMSTESPYNHQEEREVAPLPVHHTLPGVSKPRWRQDKRGADRIARERDAMGLNAKELTSLTDRVLARMNALELANSDTDFGDEEFTQAQQTTLALARLGHKTNAAIDKLFDTWPTQDWRGRKGEPPTYKSIVEYAKTSGTTAGTVTPAKQQMVVQRMEGEEW